MTTEKKHLNYFSKNETGVIVKFENLRTKIFLPISRILSFFHITANAVSYFGFLLLIPFVYFLASHPGIAAIFLLAHVLVDAFDGPLARYRHEDNDGGALTDIMCDHSGMVVVTTALTYYGLVSVVPAILYVYLYSLLIIFTIIRNRIKQPAKIVIRTKYFLYIFFLLWAFFGLQIFDYALFIFTALMTPSIIESFLFMRKYLNQYESKG